MADASRRAVTAALLGALPWQSAGGAAEGGVADLHRRFAGEAARMRAQAIAAGDQPYGAVLVRDGMIAGYGPSRVVMDSNIDAHAERVALWAAQKALGRTRLDGAVIYSTAPPCMICQPALAAAGVARMRVGPDAQDIGAPRS
ncbi:MAG: deaminase [Beijerinckiaceae bacterium]